MCLTIFLNYPLIIIALHLIGKQIETECITITL
jgi:uncharacterized membrane-anchored protein YitT (DUF2179 family)